MTSLMNLSARSHQSHYFPSVQSRRKNSIMRFAAVMRSQHLIAFTLGGTLFHNGLEFNLVLPS